MRSPLISVSLLLLAAGAAGAQSLASRVAEAPSGIVRITTAARAGVCGDGRDLVGYKNALFARNFQTIGRWTAERCVPGPLRVTLSVSDGRVTQMRTQVGGSWPATEAQVTDLGIVPPREASAYFFSILPRLQRQTNNDRLLLPAVLAEDAEVVSPLLALARDESQAIDLRRQSVHWLGTLGDATVIPVLVGFARGDAEEEGSAKGKRGLSSTAVAALSMLEGDIGVPALIDLARESNVELRRNAVFWLGQNGDPRARRMLHTVIENSGEETRVRAHAVFSLTNGSDPVSSEFAYLRGLYTRLDGHELKEAVIQGMTRDEEEGGRWLIQRAMDANESSRLRKSALFWAGQRSATPTADLVSVYRDGRNRDLREHAIFVLSQRHDDAATDALLRIAREDSDTQMRGKALFWLAQKNDPRVAKLIADLVLK
jgi:HEAT repeat protein